MQDSRWEGVLPLCREAIGVFYRPSQQDKLSLESWRQYIGKISIHNLLRLRNTIVNKSNEIKRSRTKKKKARSRRYPAGTITDAGNVYDVALFANTFTQAESLLDSLEQTERRIYLNVNLD